MDVHVDQVTSNVQVTNSQSLLNPDILNKIIRLATEQLRKEEAYEKRFAEERRLRPASSAEESSSWE